MRALSAENLYPEYQGDPDFTRGSAAVRAVAGDDADRVVASTAIVLLHPLCVRAARVPVASAWLERHRFRLTFCRRVRLTGDHVRRIWKYHGSGNDPSRSRLVGQMLTHAPALVMAVTDDAPVGEPATARLRALKGPADPRRAAPHHLRTHLGAANMFNNLAHTSDGPGELLRETAILVGSDLGVLWRTAAAARGRPRADPGARVPHDLPSSPLPDGISLAHVAVRLRRRLLAKLRAWGHPATVLEARVDREAAWVGAQDPARPAETLTLFQQLFRPPPAPVPAIAEGDPVRASARAAISAFGEIERALFAPGFDAEKLEESAARAGLSLSVRDRLVFSTHSLSNRYRRNP